MIFESLLGPIIGGIIAGLAGLAAVHYSSKIKDEIAKKKLIDGLIAEISYIDDTILSKIDMGLASLDICIYEKGIFFENQLEIQGLNSQLVNKINRFYNHLIFANKNYWLYHSFIKDSGIVPRSNPIKWDPDIKTPITAAHNIILKENLIDLLKKEIAGESSIEKIIVVKQIYYKILIGFGIILILIFVPMLII